MAQPNSSFDELASLTVNRYSKTLRDNVSNNIPTWAMFKDAGGIVEEGGTLQLIENLDFGDNATFTWFSGYDPISTTPREFATTAAFDWKECAGNATFSAREVSINDEPSKQHDLVKGKLKNLERTITNNLGAAVYYIGTESSGLAMAGAQYLIADDPTTGTVGGINRATAGNEFFRNQLLSAATESITLSATTIMDAMELLYVRCTRGMDTPNLISFGDTYWRFFAGAVATNQRYVREADSGTAKTSHSYYIFKSAKVFHDPNAAATHGYFWNTEYTKIKVHKNRNLQPDKPRQPANQRATVIPVDWMGNMITGNASLNGVLKA